MIYRHQTLDIQDAWGSLLRRPLRSLLSSLGIGIGVTALIAMLSIGEGARKNALDKIASLGTNTLRVENSTQAAFVAHDESLANISKGLTTGDEQYLSEWLGTRGLLGSYIRKDNVLISKGNRSVVGTVMGVSYQWFQAEMVRVNSGRILNQGDVTLHENICVVGNSIASLLGVHPTSSIRLQQYPTTVVGVLSAKGRLLTEGTGLSSIDFDNTIIMPITSVPFVNSNEPLNHLDGMVLALFDRREDVILEIAQQIESIFSISHRGVDDVTLVVPINLLREARESQRLFSLIMGTIAGLSLLVGGIGVMNVMLANIAEQTREIGLRMAVGASRSRIATLYLWNSILLTMSGAVWGLVCGMVVALVIQKYAGWSVGFSSFSLVFAPLSAIITGIVFGVHPAIRAASLQPAVALRDS